MAAFRRLIIRDGLRGSRETLLGSELPSHPYDHVILGELSGLENAMSYPLNEVFKCRLQAVSHATAMLTFLSYLAHPAPPAHPAQYTQHAPPLPYSHPLSQRNALLKMDQHLGDQDGRGGHRGSHNHKTSVTVIEPTII